MQQANDLLYGILKTVGQIEKNTRSAKPAEAAPAPGVGAQIKEKISILSNLGPALTTFGKVKPKSIRTFFNFVDQMMEMTKRGGKKGGENLKNLVESLNTLGRGLPSVAEGLNALGRIKERQVDRAIHSLGTLWNFIESKAGSTRKIDRVTKTFEKMGDSLKKISKPIKDISLSFAYLGVGILAFAGSLLLTGVILGLAKPTDVLMFLGVTILGFLVMFGMLALANKYIKTGTETLKNMGIGMMALALGIVSFALVLRFIPDILGSESGGSIVKSLLIMVGIVGAMALMFAILDYAGPVTRKGFMTILFMSAGIAVLSLAIMSLAVVAKMLSTGFVGSKGSEKEKDEGKSQVIRGLGTIGIIILASIALFSLLGVLSEIIIPGAITAMFMAGALFLLTMSIKKLAVVGKELGNEDIAENISHLIGGVLTGFLEGLTPLAGSSKNPVVKMANFMKNSLKIFAGVAVLMSVSVALSMFAWALTAFAELENMRVIKGTDKDGKPIFGDRINVRRVGENLTATLSNFLTGLIASTSDLTTSKAKALKKLGRALTGRRGILAGIHDFAETLQIFAKFGPEGKIGFIDFVPDGVDQDGNAKFKQVPSTVKITTVATNIADSFGAFVDALSKHASVFEIDGAKGRSMKRLSAALLGTKYFHAFGMDFGREKPGLIEPIMKFGEILATFGQYGDTNEIPIMDANGNVKGRVKVQKVSEQIVENLSKFATVLSNDALVKDIDKAEKNIGKFSGIVEELSKFSESLTELKEAGDSISNLARSLNELSISLDGFDTTKLSKLSSISANAISGVPEEGGETTADRIKTKEQYVQSKKETAERYREQEQQEKKEKEIVQPNWDLIAAQIGASVGSSLLEAMKRGQIKFEFSPSTPGKGVVSFG